MSSSSGVRERLCELLRAARLVVLSLMFGSCGESTPNGPEAAASRPEAAHASSPSVGLESPVPDGALEADQWSQDLGSIYHDERRVATFTLRNASDHVLPIRQVRSSCSCIAVRGAEARRLRPGESFEIEVELHANKGLGPYRKQVLVLTEEDGERRYTLDLSALVEPLYEVDPPKVELGELVRGEARDASVHVRLLDGSSFGRLEVATPGTASARIEFDPGATDGATVVLHFDSSGRRVGPFLAPMVLVCEHPRQPRISFQIRGTIASPVVVEPAEEVHFEPIRRSLGGRVHVTLRRRLPGLALDPPAPILETSLGSALEAHWSDQWLGEERTLELVVLPGAPAGPFQGSVVLDLGVEGLPAVVLSVHGSVDEGEAGAELH